MSIPEKIEFLRPAKYRYVKMLGNGACGETIRVHDENMDYDFVVKKYKPFVSKVENPDLYIELLERFKTEAKVLFRLNHSNVVRVYNFFDYPEHGCAYILMEFINGKDILDHLRDRPTDAEKVFEGVVDGFCHLEAKGVLHRDIRPANILVDTDGNVKIIDFGFSKLPNVGEFETKSISLNWWCETPPEFLQQMYDFQTEVYFVGKLFQHAIDELNLTDFKYGGIVRRMCLSNRETREISFSAVRSTLVRGSFAEISFSEPDTETYRKFINNLVGIIASVRQGAKFEKDFKKIQGKLQSIYTSSMLEENIPNPVEIARSFIYGSFTYYKHIDFPVETLRKFLSFTRSLSGDKLSIVFENISVRLLSIPVSDRNDLDDDIPF